MTYKREQRYGIKSLEYEQIGYGMQLEVFFIKIK